MDDLLSRLPGILATLALVLAPAALVAVVAGRWYLGLARARGWGQEVRGDGPQSHLNKQGTPSMGGVVFLLILAVAGLMTMLPAKHQGRALVGGLLIAGLGLGVIGLLDDLAKLLGHRSTGVKARFRLAAQIVVAAGAVALIEYGWLGLGGEPNLGWLSANWLPEPWRWLVQVAAIVGCANAVNFTDGVDGLASGTVAIAAVALAAIGVGMSIGPWPAAVAVAFILAAVAGACLGFLVWNWHPARMFMGDVGSMVLGGVLGAAAVALRLEILLVILGGLFVLETLSVVGQVGSFKLTGKRILRMAPLHHHLELSGWREVRIVWTAYVVQTLLAAASVVLAAGALGGGGA